MMSPITPDQAKARATIAAMAALVDLQDWERLSRCFSERLTVNYSSLGGGEPQEVTRDELIGQWQDLLPGFEATRHELGAVTISVSGEQAEGEASVSGTHLLDGEAWIVEGRYRCTLSKRADGWRITSLAYLHERETGDRRLTEVAKRRAAAGKHDQH